MIKRTLLTTTKYQRTLHSQDKVRQIGMRVTPENVYMWTEEVTAESEEDALIPWGQGKAAIILDSGATVGRDPTRLTFIEEDATKEATTETEWGRRRNVFVWTDEATAESEEDALIPWGQGKAAIIPDSGATVRTDPRRLTSTEEDVTKEAAAETEWGRRRNVLSVCLSVNGSIFKHDHYTG